MLLHLLIIFTILQSDINNLLLNWGQEAFKGGQAPANALFPLSYKTACVNVIHGQSLSGGEGMRCVTISSMSKTSIIWNVVYTSNNGRSGTVRWLAIGY